MMLTRTECIFLVELQGEHPGVVDRRILDVLRMVRLLFPGKEPLLCVLVHAILCIPDHGFRLRRNICPDLLIGVVNCSRVVVSRIRCNFPGSSFFEVYCLIMVRYKLSGSFPLHSCNISWNKLRPLGCIEYYIPLAYPWLVLTMAATIAQLLNYSNACLQQMFVQWRCSCMSGNSDSFYCLHSSALLPDLFVPVPWRNLYEASCVVVQWLVSPMGRYIVSVEWNILSERLFTDSGYPWRMSAIQLWNWYRTQWQHPCVHHPTI